MTKFENDKFYIMTPPGERWSHYEGPFDTSDEALDHLRLFVNEQCTYSPEMLRMVVVRFVMHLDGGQVDLVKTTDGVILNGDYLLSKL